MNEKKTHIELLIESRKNDTFLKLQIPLDTINVSKFCAMIAQTKIFDCIPVTIQKLDAKTV
jgi:hypothetical protein